MGAGADTAGRHVARLMQGRGGFVLVEGGPGTGKSRLLTKFAEHARAHQLPVRQGRAERRARFRPLHPLSGWRPDAEPSLLLIDDVHWSDAATVAVLRRPGDAARVLTVAAGDAGRGGVVAALHDAADEVIDLGPSSSPVVHPGAGPLPGGDTLALAAVLGTPLSLDDLVVVTGRPAAELLADLRAGEQAGVVTWTEEGFRFTSVAFEDAFAELIPPAVHPDLHRDAARRFSAAGRDELLVAHHLAEGARHPDAEAAHALVRAARSVTADAVRTELLERAREVCPPGSLAVSIAAERLGVLPSPAGAVHAVADALDLLAVRADPADRLALHLALVRHWFAAGKVTQARAHAEVALEEPSWPAPARSALLSELAIMSVPDEPDEAVKAAREALAGDEAEPEAACLAHMALAAVASARAEIAGALHHAKTAWALSRSRAADVSVHHPVALFLATVLQHADEIATASRIAVIGLAEAASQGRPVHEPHLRVCLANCFLATGEWDAALEEATSALRVAARERAFGAVPQAAWVAARVLVARGEADRALTLYEDSMAAVEPAGQDRLRTGWIAVLLAEATGDLAGALRAARAVTAVARKADARMAFRHAVQAMTLALAAADDALVSDLQRLAGNAAESLGTASARGLFLHVNGLAAADADLLVEAWSVLSTTPRRDATAAAAADAAVACARAERRTEADDLARRATRFYESVGAHRELARLDKALREAGLRRGRRGPRARAALGWEALTPSERRVAELCGDGLSNQEIGARLFVSPRTVSTHLTKVFQKLEVSSRAAVAAEVTRHRQEVAGAG